MFLTTSFAQGSNAAERPLTGFRQLTAALRVAIAADRRRRAVAAKVRQELESYDDRGLLDLGIARADIARLARDAGAATR